MLFSPPHSKLLLWLLVAAVFLVCGAPVVSASRTQQYYTRSQQAHTLRFLTSFTETIPALWWKWRSSDFCRWPGVSCRHDGVVLDAAVGFGGGYLPDLPPTVDGSQVVVRRVAFGCHGWGVLSGTLPDSWGRLTRLAELDLRSNNFYGTLPSSWAGMQSLSSLNLALNALSGTLPARWAQLARLEEVDLGVNMLSGPLPSSWSAMTALRSVSLGVNRLYGSLPESWGRMARVSVLRLSRNLFTGAVPASWGAMPRVRFVSLHHTHLCGCLPPEWSWRGVVVSADVGQRYPYCHQWEQWCWGSAVPTTEQPNTTGEPTMNTTTEQPTTTAEPTTTTTEQPTTSTEPTTTTTTTTVLPPPPPSSSSSSSVATLPPPLATTSTTTTTTTAVPSDVSSSEDGVSSLPSSSAVSVDPASSSAISAASSLSSSSLSSSAPDIAVCDRDVPHLSSAAATATRTFLLALRDAFSALAPAWQCHNYCTWEGVSCSDTGMVDVDVNSRGLVGVLPIVPDVGEEGEIMVTSIILRDNPGITGRIDLSWVFLPHLRVLDVRGCGLSDTLPLLNAL